MNDDIAFLRERDDRLRQELAATQAARAKLAVVQTEYDNAWRDVYMACLNRVAEPRAIIPLSVFRNLAIALKSNDVDVLLPEMAEELRRAVELDDTSIIRPAQLFFVAVLTEASRPGVTATKFDRFARSYSPILVQPEWFRDAAEAVREDIVARINRRHAEEAKRSKDNAIREAEKRTAELRTAASRRTALEKQLFAVHWSDKGLGPAAIRDKWNASRPRDSVGIGDAGRDDIKKSTVRGREFIAQNETTLEELISIQGSSFDPQS